MEMAQKVVLDCSGLPGQEDIDRIYAEAYEQFKAGNYSVSENIRAQADALSENMREGDVERIVDLTPEELAQREVDAVEGRKMMISHLRGQRNALLAASDWTQVPDAPLTDRQREEWRTYRQQLRDCMADCDPASHDWPAPPTKT